MSTTKNNVKGMIMGQAFELGFKELVWEHANYLSSWDDDLPRGAQEETAKQLADGAEATRKGLEMFQIKNQSKVNPKAARQFFGKWTGNQNISEVARKKVVSIYEDLKKRSDC